MDPLSSALNILTAMLTPAVLISACGTFILSTSNRLNRTIDRVRELLAQIEQWQQDERQDALSQRKLALIFRQLHSLIRRVRLLQLSMTTFYVASGVFVATSVAIGIIELTNQQGAWIPVVLGLVGAGFLFGGSVLLIIEAHLAVRTTYREMDFLWDIGKAYAPPNLLHHEAPHTLSDFWSVHHPITEERQITFVAFPASAACPSLFSTGVPRCEHGHAAKHTLHHAIPDV